MTRLVEWDGMELRVDGAKLNEFVASFPVPPVERMRLFFDGGRLRIEGSIRKFLSVPFTIEVGEITGAGRSVRVPVRSAAAFGAIPVPRFLFSLMQGRLPRGLVSFEEPSTFLVSLDRFLPPFVDVEVRRVRVGSESLMVTLGSGGADLPPARGGSNE